MQPISAESPERFRRALALFDAHNSRDPRRDLWEGRYHARELLYGQRMSAMLSLLAPEASEALRLAARCQHICRWEMPRRDWPAGRAGYLRWRSALQRFHADKAADLMREVGYGREMVERVQFLLRKEGLRRDGAGDPDSSLLEDVICIVFLKYYLPEFAEKRAILKSAPSSDANSADSANAPVGRESAKESSSSIEEIVGKSWRKMSPKGRKAALAMDLPPASGRILQRALSSRDAFRIE